MLIVWGFRSYVKTLAMLTFVCGRCGNPAAHRITQVVRKFTLFWIPLFPVSTKRYMTCAFCGASTPLTKEQLDSMLAPPAPAIQQPAYQQQPGYQQLPPAQPPQQWAPPQQ